MHSSFRLYIILYCLLKINGQRSVFGIYHLLKGKKSSQTIQDAKIFHLTPFFQSMKHLSKKDVVNAVNALESGGYIYKTHTDTYLVSQKGRQIYCEWKNLFPIPRYLNGFQYHKKAAIFWQRFALSVQTLSHLLYDDPSFIPMVNEDEVQIWVKEYFKEIDDRQKRADHLFCELHHVLKQLPNEHATIFVLHLSGYQRSGYTLEQIGQKLELDVEYTLVLFQSILHFIIGKMEKNDPPLRYLQQFLEKEQKEPLLTLSSQKTYALLKENKTISEIAKIRKLKVSTIEDHIVEIASMNDRFPIESFVSKEEQEKIAAIIQSLGVKRLKPIRNELSSKVSYFQIRLVLGRMKNNAT